MMKKKNCLKIYVLSLKACLRFVTQSTAQPLSFPSHEQVFGHSFKPPGTIHGDEINDTVLPFFWRGPTLLHSSPVVLLQMGVSTQKGIRRAQMGMQIKWST